MQDDGEIAPVVATVNKMEQHFFAALESALFFAEIIRQLN